MKRFLVGLIVAAVAAIGLGSVSASASNGATVIHFTAAPYTINGFDTWTCSGRHIVNHGLKHGALSKDKETCIISNAPNNYSGEFSGNPRGIWPDGIVGGWGSDYNGAAAIRWNMDIERNADGTFTAEITAYYATR